MQTVNATIPSVITVILETVSLVISIISITVVIYGTVIALIAFFRTERHRIRGNYNSQFLRILRADLGTYLLLGLEFLIAADILKTILEPGITELLSLGGIVLLRTVLSFFLTKEIQEIEQERKEHPEYFQNTNSAEN
ncbi:MAG: DUF1622 domain-containing protein [Spirochaetaceae bacterium]|nr:DUF1622 domain-containing protein [Spirochaetaceae bacterium]MBP5329616.1 DUF1622 domain-containing protein [Spirochaetaceae bacterium]